MIRLIGCALLASFALNAAHAARYQIGAEDSRLQFSGEISGESFEGRFERFTGQLSFDPTRLDDTSIVVEIDMGTVNTDSEERDEALATAEWFDPENFPKARFQAEGAAAAGDKFVSMAQLTIRGVSKPVRFTFQLDRKLERLTGTASLDRTVWDLGGEDWRDEDLVAHAVLVKVDVKLTAQP
ncbi:MAG: YceI family protein [Xanthomonadales bacterium]|nr:YceI family protein [Xanthomonadales bacterium]